MSLQLVIFCFTTYFASSNENIEVYLSKKSSIVYELPEYISGVNLKYKYVCDNADPSIIEIYQSSLNISIMSAPLDYGLGVDFLESIQMATRWLDDYGLAFYYTNTSVVCLKVDTIHISVSVHWYYNFINENDNKTIVGVQPIIVGDNESLLFVVIESNIGLNPEFYIVDFENIANLNVFDINIKAIENYTEISLNFNFRSEFVPISADFMNKTNMLVIDFNNLRNPSVQNISTAYSITEESELNINPVSAFILKYASSINLFILDKQNYLIYFVFENGSFHEISSINLKIYGKVQHIYPHNNQGIYLNQVFIYTAIGILLLDIKTMSEIKLINITYVGEEFGFFESNNFLFILKNILGGFSISVANLKFPDSILFSGNAKCPQCIGQTFWGTFQAQDSTLLLKIDQGNWTLHIINVYIPAVEFLAPSDNNYTCNVYPIAGDKLSGGLTVNVILNDDSVYAIKDMYNRNANLKKQNLKFDFKSLKSNFSISTTMYSGWSKTCDFYKTDLNQSDFQITPISNQKYHEFGHINVRNDSVKLRFLDIYIITIMDQSVELYDIYHKTSDIVDLINATDVMQVLRSDGNKALLFIFDNNEIAIYSYPSGNLTYQIFNDISKVEFYNAISDYLIIGDSNKLDIYSYNFTSENYNLVSSGIIRTSTTLVSIKSIKSNDEGGGILLYLNINNSAIQIFNLETISAYSFPFYIYEFTIDNLKEFVVTGSGCFILTGSKIYAYDILLQSLRFSFFLNINNGFPLKDVAAVPYKGSILFFNVSETHLNYAVYLQIMKVGDIIGYDYYKTGGSVIAVHSNETVELFWVKCPDSKEFCDTDTWFDVLILNQSNLKSNEYQANLSIVCSNFNDTEVFDYQANFYLYGMSILLNNRTFIKNISYVSEDTFFASEYAKGADLQFQLMINNQAVNNLNKSTPMYFVDSLHKTIEIKTNHTLNSIALVKNTSYILASTKDKLLLLYDFSNQSFNETSHIPLRHNSECPLIETISTDDKYVLFAAICKTATIGSLTKPSLVLVLINLKNFSDIKVNVSYPNFNVGSLRAVTSSITKFALILVEDNKKINNRVQVFFGEWKDGTIILTSNAIINFYTMKLSQFLCEGADGFYPSTGDFELYLVDSYYGLRVLTYANNAFTQEFGYEIGQPVKSIGYCGKILFVGCLDTSVLTFAKHNKKFRYSVKFYPLSNSTNMYTARSGYINCNDYYDPSFFALPIESANMYVMRIINIMIESPSSILRDVFISDLNSDSTYYSNAKFYNTSLFIVADTNNGKILGFNVESPYLYFPSFSHSEFKEIENKWGSSPYSFSLIFSSGNFSLSPQYYTVDRGDIMLSSSSVSTSISNWKVGLIIGSVLAALILIGFIMYKYFLKKRKLKEELNIEESENHKRAIYRSSVQFNIQSRFSY